MAYRPPLDFTLSSTHMELAENARGGSSVYICTRFKRGGIEMHIDRVGELENQDQTRGGLDLLSGTDRAVVRTLKGRGASAVAEPTVPVPWELYIAGISGITEGSAGSVRAVADGGLARCGMTVVQLAERSIEGGRTPNF